MFLAWAIFYANSCKPPHPTPSVHTEVSMFLIAWINSSLLFFSVGNLCEAQLGLFQFYFDFWSVSSFRSYWFYVLNM